MSSPRESYARPALIIGLATFLCYGGLGLSRLGFYHDDWSLLSPMTLMGGGFWDMVLGQLRGSSHAYRPLSVVCWTLPYWLFGLKAGLWQGAMAGLTAALCLVYYMLLRGFGAPRSPAALAALLFLAFPNKDSTLYWPDVSLILSVSLLCFLGSCLAQARYVRTGRASVLALAVVLLLLALAAYEQCFFLLPVWALAPGAREFWPRLRRSLFAGGAALLAFALYKFVVLPYFVPYNKTLGFSVRHAVFVYYMALRALLDPRWFVYLARCARQAVIWHPLLSAGALALPWLARAALSRPAETAGEDAGRRLILWGIAVYVLGYLPFCFSDYAPGAYDHMNRLNQLPAAGLCAALCGWALASGKPRRTAVLASAAGVCLVIHVAFSGIWRESYRRQLEVRDRVLSVLSEWPQDKALLVVLPELYAARKAPVFLSGYDIGSAIRIWTGDSTREALVYSEWVSFGTEGLSFEGRIRPYASFLMLDAGSGRLSALDARSARALPPVLQPWEKPVTFWPQDGP
jgi:hypothetical protein